MKKTVIKPFAFPQAWRAADFKDVDDISIFPSLEQITALEERLADVNCRGLSLTDITASDFQHPDLDDVLASTLNELLFGRGVVVMRGLPADRYDADDMAKMYWGIGTHFGIAVSQSAVGDRLSLIHISEPTPRDLSTSRMPSSA